LKTEIEKTIVDFGRFRRRIGMYVARIDSANAHAFLMGFDYALVSAGVDIDWSAHAEARGARGYHDEPTGLVPQMHQRGMDERAVMDELIALEIDGFRRQLAKLASRSQAATHQLPRIIWTHPACPPTKIPIPSAHHDPDS
jgi:hypothetical protein